MNEIIHSADYLLKFLVIVLLLLLFWIFEAVWQHDKRWALPILVFPPILLVATFFAWKLTRARCFFFTLFLVMVILLGAVAHYNYFWDLLLVMLDLSIWPYYLFKQIF